MNKKLCLIGKNISHSLSPNLYNNFFESNNIDAKYYLHEVDNLNNFINVKSKEYAAFNVTYPYKTEIIKYLNNKENFFIESPNLIINSNNKLIGYNTDGIGFYEGMISNKIDIKNKKITIIGNGGAGKSINNYLKKITSNEINMLTHKDTDLLLNNDTNKIYDILNILYNTNLLINASTSGFKNENESPIPLDIAKQIFIKNINLIYIDIIYKTETKLLKYYRDLGVKTLDGIPMLHGQFNNNIKILKENNII